jgi:hypothetical protein
VLAKLPPGGEGQAVVSDDPGLALLFFGDWRRHGHSQAAWRGDQQDPHMTSAA